MMARPKGTPQPPLPDEKRCIRNSGQSGERCKKPRRPGLQVCATHGGSTKLAISKSERFKVEKALSATLHRLDPISEDDADANPMQGFLNRYRLLQARRRYITEKIKEVHDQDESSLVWGTSKQEDVGASEFSGVNTTFEAKLNVYVVWEMQVMKELHDMEKTWINAKLDTRRLEIEAATVEKLDSAIVTMLRLLGKDPHDPEVRQVVREALALTA